MKTNLSKQTKYYKKIYNKDKKDFELIEVPLNPDNWWYVQIDASIRTAFLTYNCYIPKYVVIEQYTVRFDTECIVINIFRENLKSEKDLLEWNQKWIYIKSDLDRQAQANTDEFGDTPVVYKFKLL